MNCSHTHNSPTSGNSNSNIHSCVPQFSTRLEAFCPVEACVPSAARLADDQSIHSQVHQAWVL